MGASKKQFFPKNQNTTANLCKAMAHPARVAIIEHLINVHRCIGEEFLQIIPLSQPSISRHINELILVGLIYNNFENNSYVYEINPFALQSLNVYFVHITSSFNFTPEC